MSSLTSAEVERWLDSNPDWFQSYALSRMDASLVTRWSLKHGYTLTVSPSPSPAFSFSVSHLTSAGIHLGSTTTETNGWKDPGGPSPTPSPSPRLATANVFFCRDRAKDGNTTEQGNDSDTAADKKRYNDDDNNDRHTDGDRTTKETELTERGIDRYKDKDRDRGSGGGSSSSGGGLSSTMSSRAICVGNISPGGYTGGRRDSMTTANGSGASPSLFQSSDFVFSGVGGDSTLPTGAARTLYHHHHHHHQRANSKKYLRQDFARSRIRSLLLRGAHDPSVSFEQDSSSSASLAERRSSLRGMRQFLSLPTTTGEGSALSLLIQSKVRLPRYVSKNDDFKRELRRENERDFFLEIVRDISIDLDLDSLTNRILVNVSILVLADRSAISFVEGAKGNQFLVTRFFNGQSKLERFTTVREEVTSPGAPWGSGILGYVAETGHSVNLKSDCQDLRFGDEFSRLLRRASGEEEDVSSSSSSPGASAGDQSQSSLLCMPIYNLDGDVIAVAQAHNKKAPETEVRAKETEQQLRADKDGDDQTDDVRRGEFTEDDEKILETYLAFCGMTVSNAQAIDAYIKEYDRNKTLLEVVHDLFEEQTTVQKVVTKIMERAQSLLKCERCVVLLEENESNAICSSGIGQLFDLQRSIASGNGSESISSSPTLVIRPRTSSCGSNTEQQQDMTSLSGTAVNLSDVQLEAIFSVASGRVGSHIGTSVMCKAIRNSSFQTIGAAQLINRLDGKPFDENDERLFEAFTIFCGLGINNCLAYDEKALAAAKQAVALEVISYHATVSPDLVSTFKKLEVPPASEWLVDSPEFNDFSLDGDQMVLAAIRIFQDTGLIKTFKIDYETLIRWMLTIKKNYRNVAYHNWRHAFNVCQFMFTVLETCRMKRHLSDLERLALLVACLCHDLDHRGTNNSFQQKSSSALSQLYGTQATLEHHHFNHAVMILNSEKHNIFANLSSDDYSSVMQLLKQAILATDLSLHMQVRKRFFPVVESNDVDWRDGCQRELLRSVLMTTCDIGAITKPWPTQVRAAEQVVMEFFDQGDKERAMLNIQPPAMMDRERSDELPRLQIEWIDGICLPLYRSLAPLDTHFQKMLDNVLSNRQQWETLQPTESLPEEPPQPPETQTVRQSSKN